MNMHKTSLATIVEEIETKIRPVVHELETIEFVNQQKIIEAFQRKKISDFHFADSTGYGYNDVGRELLDEIYAEVFGAEAAIVRPHFASGTHTIATALFGVLRPGDHLLYITGTPYDTLHKVIGEVDDGIGSLRDWHIEYDESPLLPDGSINWQDVEQKLQPHTKMIGIQRSRGYDIRPSFTIAQIADMVKRVKAIRPDVLIFADNCYGEFAEEKEPTEVGVDLIAGSLIKNPGGGIVPSGGYIAGQTKLVELAANQLTAPGIGNEVGAMLGQKRMMYQGLFLAPHIVGQALRGIVFASAMFERLGLSTDPAWDAKRTDLIQAIHFGEEEALVSFVQSIQQAAAVDAYVTPIASEMPGYDYPVIMAAGTFIQGGSLELSADAPIRPPYTAFMQGGLTYAHVKYAVIQAIEKMIEKNLLVL